MRRTRGTATAGRWIVVVAMMATTLGVGAPVGAQTDCTATTEAELTRLESLLAGAEPASPARFRLIEETDRLTERCG